MPAAIFGITNNGLNLAVSLFVLMLVVVWLALIVYTFLDARRRISDPVLVACATAASLFPYIGTIVYVIVRPPEFIEDARERDLEMKASALQGAPAGRALLPQLRVPDREELPALPPLPAPSQGPLPDLRQAGRSSLGALPLLRVGAARARPPAARRRSRNGPRRRSRRDAGSAPSRPTPAPSRRRSSGPGARRRRTRRSRMEPTPRPSGRRRVSRGRRRAARSPRAGPRGQSRERNALMSRTLILVKPDAFERALTGEVLARFERKGLRIVALKLMTADASIANEHYAEHAEKPFFGELVSFITGGPLVAGGARGARGGDRGAAADRRHQPGRGGAGLDPRRLRARGDLQHGPRVGLGRVGRS